MSGARGRPWMRLGLLALWLGAVWLVASRFAGGPVHAGAAGAGANAGVRDGASSGASGGASGDARVGRIDDGGTGGPAAPAAGSTMRAGTRTFWVAGSDDPLPPTAHPDLEAHMRADLDAPRSPSDGGGRLKLALPAGDDGSVVAGQPRRWSLEYEAGPFGIAVGGVLRFNAPPFWFWSPAQTLDENAPGFLLAATDAPGVQLVTSTPVENLVLIEVRGRGLQPGESLRLLYGAGPALALGDRFAESASPFQLAVDGDGDGVSAFLPDPPTIVVHAGPPAQLRVTLDSSARPGGDCRLTLAVLDAVGNAGVAVEDDFALILPPGLQGPATLHMPPEARGVLRVNLHVAEPGADATAAPIVHRVEVRASDGATATSNPLQVSRDAPRILWADLHGHSALSDGTGTPQDYYRYARDVAALDVSALTDHDHWGFPFLDQAPELWEHIREQTRAFHEPGRFVTVLGFEWTNWIHGHRHVLYFSDEGGLLSAMDPRYASPRQLWDALAGRDALTVAHHTAGGPIAENWSFRPDAVLEPVTEVASVHGTSEAADCPARIYNWVEGNTARDALEQGYSLGFIGSGDGHDGHPGLTMLAAEPGRGGLAAVLSEELTRPAVLSALRRRAAYATNGPRIVLRATLDGREMGSSVPPGDAQLSVFAAGTGTIARVSLVRSGALVDELAGDGLDVEHRWPIRDLRPGEFLSVRIEQADGGLAWSSAFFVE